MSKTTTLGILAIVSGIALSAEHTAATIEAPPVGTTLTYDCKGPWAKRHIMTIAWVNDGKVRTEGTVDGREFWIEQPIFTAGLTLFIKHKRSNRSGIYTQSFEIDNLEQLVNLEPGSTYSGTAIERGRNGKSTWGYDISVGEPVTIEQSTRGRIEVIPVFEERVSYKSSYSSTLTTFFEKESSSIIGWHFKDVNGKQTCELVSME